MAETAGDHNDKDDDRTKKRPVPTIEGKAEEIAVEPIAGEASQQAEVDETPKLASEQPSEMEVTGGEAEASDEGESEGEAEEAEDHEPVAPPNTDRSQLTSFVTHLAAGFLGGLIGVIALAFAWHLVPAFLVGRKANADLAKRVAALEASQAQAAKAPAGASTQAVKALQQRVAGLEQTLQSMAAQSKAGGSVADAAAIGQQIQAAEKRMRQEVSQEIKQQIGPAIDQRLSASAKASAKAGAGEADKALQALSGEVNALKSQLAALSQSQAAKAASGADAALVKSLEARLSKLEGRMPALAGAVAKTDQQARQAAAQAALADLRDAVHSGRPYQAELDQFTALAPKGADLGILPKDAKAGVPSMGDLRQRFLIAKAKALTAPVTPAQNSFLDTLITSAQSVVTIRKLNGKGEGNSPEAVLTRAGLALERGDLAAAADTVADLDDRTKAGKAAKAAMADWLAAARERLAADAALSHLAIGATAPATGTSPPATEGQPG